MFFSNCENWYQRNRQGETVRSWYYDIKEKTNPDTEHEDDVLLKMEAFQEMPTGRCEGFPKEFSRSTDQIELSDLTEFLRKSEDIRMGLGFRPGDPRFHIANEEALNSDCWFIGDVHGDSLALKSVLMYIQASSPDPTYVFLGDLFDRHPHGLEVLKIVVDLIRKNPGKVLWLTGNHDEALKWDAEKRQFTAALDPREFSDWLNAQNRPEYNEFAKAVCGLIEKLPYALVFNDLAAFHAGVPATSLNANVWDNINDKSDMDRLIRHFVWNRLESTSRKKLAPAFSWAEIQAFIKKMRELGLPVIHHYLRGHDHCGPLRHEWTKFPQSYYREQEGDVENIGLLTFTTMALMDSGERYQKAFSGYSQASPTIVHYNNKMSKPMAITIQLPENSCTTYYAPTSELTPGPVAKPVMEPVMESELEEKMLFSKDESVKFDE